MSVNPRQATWLFDLGNSRLKGAWLDGRAPAQPLSLAWEAVGFDATLHARLSQWPAPDRVLVASVAGAERADRLRGALQGWPSARQHWLRSPRRGCGITNRYGVAERLGIDRFLAMVAARAAASGAGTVVIGCGTALTLDAVDADGLQQDGLIAPSPELMLRALRGATAIGESNPRAFDGGTSDDTALAMVAGCQGAAARLVDWYYDHKRATLGAKEPDLWLHGGWADALQILLGQTACHGHVRLLEDAVLRGLAIWAHQDAPPGT